MLFIYVIFVGIVVVMWCNDYFYFIVIFEVMYGILWLIVEVIICIVVFGVVFCFIRYGY